MSESHAELAWRAIDAAEQRGETVAEETIDAIVGEAEARDAAGVPLTVEAVREYEVGAGREAAEADAAYARKMRELGVVAEAEDAFALAGAVEADDADARYAERMRELGVVAEADEAFALNAEAA